MGRARQGRHREGTAQGGKPRTSGPHPAFLLCPPVHRPIDSSRKRPRQEWRLAHSLQVWVGDGMEKWMATGSHHRGSGRTCAGARHRSGGIVRNAASWRPGLRRPKRDGALSHLNPVTPVPCHASALSRLCGPSCPGWSEAS